MPTVNYLPYEQRVPDTQYKDALRLIVEQGIRTNTQQDVDALTMMGGVHFRFDIKNGFPMITERNMSPKPSERMPVTVWQQAMGEIFAFINGVHTQKGLEEFGCMAFWRDTVSEEKCSKRGLETGDLGPGSYGAVFAGIPTPDGGRFNQVEACLKQIKEKPHLRTHFIDPWYSPYVWRGNQKVVVCPCHGWIHIRILNGELYYHMHQRSGDMVLGVPNNIIEHVGLAMAFAQATGYPLAQYSHSISDAHIYVNHMEAVEKMLARESRPFPTMHFDESVTDLFAARREHFTLEDYNPHPGIGGIPLAV